jgi:hypothetical protein
MDNSLKPEKVKIQGMGQGSYEDRRSALLTCIKKFLGHTEKWYADVMTLNHVCARKTTLEIIRHLVSDGQIHDNKVGNSFHSYSIIHFTENKEIML